MLRKSQGVISDVTHNIMAKVQKEIKTLERANNSKGAYSSEIILGILEQIKDQISYVPNNSEEIIQPGEHVNLRLDSHMSVFNVKTREFHEQAKAKVKPYRVRKMTSVQDKSKVFFRRRNTTFNRLKSLSLADLGIRQDTEKNQFETLQDIMRVQLQKRKQKMEEKKKREIKTKTFTRAEHKQKFSYDYEFDRLKVNNQQFSNLIKENKSLIGELSKKIQKNVLASKVKKPEVSTVQVTKVVEKVKKSLLKRRKVEEEISPQPIQVEFSDVKSLSDHFKCEQGVNFTFEGTVLKRKAKNVDPAQKRLSRLQFELLKRRTKTSMSEPHRRQEIHRTMDVENNTMRNSKTLNPLQTSLFSNAGHRRNGSSISIENQLLLQSLLSPQYETITTQAEQNLSKWGQKPRSNRSLDKIDQFNIQYMKGFHANKKVKVPLKNKQQSSNLLTPKGMQNKIPFLKVREKLQNKHSIINEMKKKFEETLRKRSQICAQ